jgi:sugar O-acyltransferase (sialic acid O-acetyltransferase NeuD family)
MKQSKLSEQIHTKRIAIIGSAKGGGALQVIDAIQGSKNLVPVAVFDSDVTMLGRKILGIPVVGSSQDVVSYYHQEKFDCVVIAIGDVETRANLYGELKSSGLPFENVIDSSAQIRAGTTLGEGNVILANVFLGPEVSVGNNCYIITNTVINHHSVIGDHCYFSSGVTLAGRVSVQKKVRFDTASGAIAGIDVGEGSRIPGGCILTASVPAKGA